MSDSNPEFNFEHDLPAGDSFSLHWLAKRWKCSVTHIFRLVLDGEFGKGAGVDLRGSNSSKSMIRLRRAAVVSFLNRRKDLEKIAEESPQPKPRPSKRRKKKARKS